MRRLALLLPGLLLGCSDWNLKHVDDPDGISDPGTDTAYDPTTEDLGACSPDEWPPEAVAASDTCAFGGSVGFDPVVAWEVKGTHACSLPAVGDLDGDGMPEIVVTWGWLFSSKGELAVYEGDGSGEVWETSGAQIAYGSGPVLGDVDRDGKAEIFAVKLYEDNLFGNGKFSVVKYDLDGNLLAESEQYTDAEFDHATSLILSDLDHDGAVEVVAGRAILNDDLTERGVGRSGRGSDDYFGGIGPMYGEGSSPSVSDIDLDGNEDIVVGNAVYDADGHEVMSIRGGEDGATAIANLDSDAEGEFLRATYGTLEAIDTDGSNIWTVEVPGGGGDTDGIMSIPAVGDIDGDGLPEIIEARANRLWAYNGEDGSVLWSRPIEDLTGATGASMFDFEGDGALEVIYIDEVAMYAFNGPDGAVKFKTDKHASDTMYDYPVIADVDADGHADIVVTHDQYTSGMSVYRDAANSWGPARRVWNQHPYIITNVNDDLTIPQNPTQNFSTYNSFHSATAVAPGEALDAELEVEVVETCADDCDRGWYNVTARARNSGGKDIPAGLSLAIYAEVSGTKVLLDTAVTTTATPKEMTSEAVVFSVKAADLELADRLVVQVDDDGTGTGSVSECTEIDNEAVVKKPFCE